MKNNSFLSFFIGLILILNLLMNDLNAQAIDSLSQITILKSWNENNPYGESHTKWLEKNGFSTHEYNWGGLNINRELEESKKERTATVLWGGLSGFILYLAMDDDVLSVQRNKWGMSVVPALIALSKSISAKKRVKRAESLRLNYKPVSVGSIIRLVEANEIFIGERSLKDQEIRWLKKNYFDVDNYSWNDEKINFYANKALDNRISRRANVGAGILTLVGSLYLNGMAAVIDGGASSVNKIYLIPAGFFMISMILDGSSKKNLRIANRLKSIRNN